MKRLLTMATAVLLLASCHHGERKQAEDSVTTVPTPSQSTIVSDTLATHTADTTSAMPQPTGQQLQQDSAETVNLRLFTRKQKNIYSPALIIGEWLRGSEHEQYMADGSGKHWDTGEDVSRGEAQSFLWTMDSNLLTFKYKMALGGLMVRQYVVTFVDDESLVYRDAYDDSYMWEKVPAGFTDRP